MTLKTVLAAAACAAALAAQAAPAAAPAKGGSMLVRIAEIEVFPQHLEEYVNHPRLKAKACESLG